MKSPIVLSGILNERRAIMPKDGGCSTNVISRFFTEENHRVFRIVKKRFQVCHTRR